MHGYFKHKIRQPNNTVGFSLWEITLSSHIHNLRVNDELGVMRLNIQPYKSINP